MSQDTPENAPEPVEPSTPVEPGTPEASSTAETAADPAAAAPVPPAPAPSRPAAGPGTGTAPAPEPELEAELDEQDAWVLPAGSVVTAGPSLAARLGAEVFGSFVFVLAGLGVALYAGTQFASFGGGGGSLAVALGFGLALAGVGAAVGHVSGGHFNPAVTLGAAVGGRTAWRDLLPYWLAQVVGAVAAASLLFIAYPAQLAGLLSEGGTTRKVFSGLANGYGEHTALGTATQGDAGSTLFIAVVVELVLTAVLVGVVLGVTDRRARSTVAPFAIGLTFTVLVLVALPVTNGALNPARATAAAIFAESWALAQLWVFWVAPLVGAAIAGLVYRAFAAEPREDNLLEEDDAYVTTDDVVVVEQR